MVRSEVFIPKSVFLIWWQKVYFCCHTSSFLCRGSAHVTVGRHNKKQSHLALTGINNLQFLVAKPGLGPTTAKSLHKVWTSHGMNQQFIFFWLIGGISSGYYAKFKGWWFFCPLPTHVLPTRHTERPSSTHGGWWLNSFQVKQCQRAVGKSSPAL